MGFIYARMILYVYLNYTSTKNTILGSARVGDPSSTPKKRESSSVYEMCPQQSPPKDSSQANSCKVGQLGTASDSVDSQTSRCLD